MQLRIRPMRRADAADVYEVERCCFSRPWTEPELRDFIRRRSQAGLVAEVRDVGIVGAVLYGIYEECDGFTGVSIASICVLQRWRRRGVGRALLSTIKASVKRFMANENDTECHLFLSAIGFRCVRVSPEEFDEDPDNPRDGYEFVWER